MATVAMIMEKAMDMDRNDCAWMMMMEAVMGIETMEIINVIGYDCA